MYPRFGMAYVALRTAEARRREFQLRQDENLSQEARGTPPSDYNHSEEAGAMWRMVGVIAVVLALSGAIAWFAA